MTWLCIGGVIVIMLVIVYSCCVASGRADRAIEKNCWLGRGDMRIDTKENEKRPSQQSGGAGRGSE